MAVLNESNAAIKISDLERVAISLAIQGRTKTEIAERMNMKMKSIEKLLNNANRKLALVSAASKEQL